MIPWLESSLADESQEMEAVLSDGSSVEIVQAPNGSWYAFHNSDLVARTEVRASALALLETNLKRKGLS